MQAWRHSRSQSHARTGQAALVALAICSNVHRVPLLQLGNLVLDCLPAGLGLAGGIGGEVGVAAGAVPVAGDGLGVKGHLDVVQLCGKGAALLGV